MKNSSPKHHETESDDEPEVISSTRIKEETLKELKKNVGEIDNLKSKRKRKGRKRNRYEQSINSNLAKDIPTILAEDLDHLYQRKESAKLRDELEKAENTKKNKRIRFDKTILKKKDKYFMVEKYSKRVKVGELPDDIVEFTNNHFYGDRINRVPLSQVLARK